MSQTTTNLQISIEEPAAWSRKLVITVPAERVRTERLKVARQLAKRVRIPGFRKGKIPLERMEARFGPDIDRHTRQQVIDTAFREAVNVKELDPISEPRVANVVYDRDAELTFEVAFDIRPDVKLGRLGGFRLSRPEVTVREEEVAERLEEMRRQLALWRPVERKPTVGDSVEVEITPLEDLEEEEGKAGGEEAEPQGYRFVLGQGQAIPEVESAILTLDPGATNEFTVSFPADFPDEEKRGSRQRLRIHLKQALEQELPVLDDEFARSVGEFEDLDGLREAIREDVRRLNEREAEAKLNHDLIDQVIQANPLEVPESMVARYLDALIGAANAEADPDAVAEARREARPAAEWGIRRQLIVQWIAEDQGFAASREEIQERVQALAKRVGRPVAEIRAKLGKSGELRDIERSIVEEKVFRYLREQSDIAGVS